MQTVKGETIVPPIWDEFKAICKNHSEQDYGIEMLERFNFYDVSKEAYVIIATGGAALYANVILQKGVL